MTAGEAFEVSAPLRALIIDDAPELHQILEPLLGREGFDVRVASDGEVGVAMARTFDPDVILLDLMLPGVDGLEVCRQIRGFTDAYVMMITAKDSEIDRVVGLSIGADDYMAKPFSTNELIARVRAMLRRPRKVGRSVTYGGDEQVKHFGPLAIDIASREVTVQGTAIDLTRIEFDLLATLCSRPRLVFSRAQLLETVWGPNWYGDTHVVDVHMSNLRKKLADRDRSTRFVQTVRGVGFRLSDDVTKHTTPV